MVYLPTIPAATDKPAQSQSAIQENYTQLNNQFKTEHVAFDAAADNGQHKFVTLKRSAGVVPAGTNWVLAQAMTAAPNPYLQLVTATSNFSVPHTYYFIKNIVAGSGTRTLIDFGAGGINLFSQSGHIILYDNNNTYRTLFSPFIYSGGVLRVASSGGIPSGQLNSTNTFEGFDTAGSVLRVIVNSLGGGGTIVSVKITGTAI